MKLWLDDLREAPEGFIWVKSFTEAIAVLEFCRLTGKTLECVSLDNDLGVHSREGRKVALWMAEHDEWPKEVRVHSANPVAAEYMQGIIARYKS